jgi:hypothetical protein
LVFLVITNPFDGILLIINCCWFFIGVYDFPRGVNFVSICFKIFSVSQSYFLQMGQPEATNLMDMPSHVRFNILKFLWVGEYDAWEYNENGRVLIVDLHKLLAPVIDGDENQMTDILAHVYLGVVDHLVIHAYLESCERDRYSGHCMTLYHPIYLEWFPELDNLVHNPPPNMLVTVKMHGDDIDDENE